MPPKKDVPLEPDLNPFGAFVNAAVLDAEVDLVRHSCAPAKAYCAQLLMHDAFLTGHHGIYMLYGNDSVTALFTSNCVVDLPTAFLTSDTHVLLQVKIFPSLMI